MLKFKLEQKECPKDDRYVLIKRLWNQHLFALHHPMTGSCSLRCNKTFCKMRRSNKAFVSNVCDIASRYVNTVMHLCYRNLSHTYQSGLNIVTLISWLISRIDLSNIFVMIHWVPSCDLLHFHVLLAVQLNMAFLIHKKYPFHQNTAIALHLRTSGMHKLVSYRFVKTQTGMEPYIRQFWITT